MNNVVLFENCADVAHLVERNLAKVEVASSSLVIRSRNAPTLMYRGLNNKE